MRWVTKTTEPPRHGDERTRRVFAWKPTKVGRYTVFLESFLVEERFHEPTSGAPGWWTEFNRSLCIYS